MIILDQTIVNVALPSIQNDLRFSQSSLAWVVNAYLIAFGGLLLLLLAGRLGDLIGRRRILHPVGFGAVAILLLAGFVARQATAINPLLPLRMFRSRNVSAANLIQFLMVAGLLGFFFLSTLYLQRVLGLHPLEIGLAFLPIALAIGTLSLGFSARLSTRIGARAVLLPGLRLIAAGLALLTRAPVASSYVVDLLPAILCSESAPACRFRHW